MEHVGGALGALWIAVAAVLAGAAVVGSLRARSSGRVPGEWTLLLPGTLVLVAMSFLLLRLIEVIAPAPDSAADSEGVPQLVPDWTFAETTAIVAGTVAGIAALAWVICFILRGRMQHRRVLKAEAAVMRQRREESEDR